MGGLEQYEPGVLFSEQKTARVASHFPVNRAGAKQVKFLT